MDIEDLRALMTVVSFAAFLAVVVWAYGRGRSERFDEAARLPFAELGDEPAASRHACAQRAGADGAR